MDKVTRQCPQTTINLFEEKGEPKRYRTEVLPLTARPNWLTGGNRFLGALRPRRRDGLLGTGTEWEGDDRVKARPRKPPEKDRGPPPEQWKC